MNAPVRTNAFRSWWENGYKDIIPVVPPDADLSENSYIKKNNSAGKAPGIKYPSGHWGGMPGWREHETTEADIEAWHAMGASVGLRRGDAFVLDIDAYDEETAAQIEQDAIAALGPAPCRVGNWPKRALLYRADGPILGAKLVFENKSGKGKPNQIETPAQVVVFGKHQSGRFYEWPRKPVSLDRLSSVSQERLNAFLEDQRKKLPAAQRSDTGNADRTTINQNALTGRADLVTEVVRRLPNTREHFPTYDDMIRVGNAISAALPNDRDLANELWHEFCGKWEGGDYSYDLTERRWRTLKPPHAFGAGYLYDLADKIAPHESGASFKALEFLEVVEDCPLKESLTAEASSEKSKERSAADQIKATLYDCPEPTAIPPREWIYGNHYIRQFVSTTVAPSGVGKSSLEIVEALAMASGKPLLGVQPRGQFRVWLWNGEDPRDELNRRVAAAMQHYGLTREDLGGRLFVDTGRETEIVLGYETRDGVKINEPIERAIMGQIEFNAFDVMQVDPFVSSHRVTENDNGAIDLVTKRWARIADVGRCSIELVHHVRKLNGTEITVEDGRGAVALLATSRSARAIAKMSKNDAARLGLEAKLGRLFRFADGKNNLALPAGDREEWFELVSVNLGNGPRTSGDALEAVMAGDSVGVVTRAKDLSGARIDAREGAVEVAKQELKDGEWRRDSRSGDAWAGHVVARCYGLDLDDANDKARAKAILSDWIRQKFVREVSRKDATRRMRTYVELVDTDNLSEKEGVFA